MEAKRPFALCYMDLDDFKQVNDTYGHDCGDQLLNGFAERLQSALSTAGTLIRLGGDEFIAILYGVSERCIAGERFRRMLEAIGSEPYHLEGIDLNPGREYGAGAVPLRGRFLGSADAAGRCRHVRTQEAPPLPERD